MHRRRASLPPEYEPISLAPQIIPSSQSISISNASQQRYQSLQTLLADIGVDKADPDSHHLRGGLHLGCGGDFTRGSDHHAPKPGPSYARTAAADPSDARALVPHAPVSLQWPHSSVMDLLMQQALAPYDPNLASVLKGHRPSWTSNMGLGLSPSALADAITSCLNSGTDGKILALSLPLTRSAQPTGLFPPGRHFYAGQSKTCIGTWSEIYNCRISGNTRALSRALSNQGRQKM